MDWDDYERERKAFQAFDRAVYYGCGAFILFCVSMIIYIVAGGYEVIDACQATCAEAGTELVEARSEVCMCADGTWTRLEGE